MTKIKIFRGTSAVLQNEINAWLQSPEIAVIKSVRQTECDTGIITISILYVEVAQ